MRTRLMGSQEHDAEEKKVQWSLRPRTLAEYIGQPGIVENLSICLRAAKMRDEPLDHVLLYGPPGLGKTTLAHIIAAEMNSKIICTSGPAIERTGDLMGILTNLEEKDVLFIDEIHRLSRVVEEFLYPAMEDFQVDFIIDRGAFARTIKVPLKRFTLIGATTRAGALSSALRERFGIYYHFDFYSEADLTKIVTRSASLINVPITPESARMMAARSRGTPRIANRLLHRVRDYAQVLGDGSITPEMVEKGLQMEGVDHLGLDEMDRKYLRAIVEVYKGGPVGIDAIAATLNEDVQTLEDMVEPYLLKMGFITRTPAGRKATAAAWQHLGLSREEPGDRQQRLFEGFSD